MVRRGLTDAVPHMDKECVLQCVRVSVIVRYGGAMTYRVPLENIIHPFTDERLQLNDVLGFRKGPEETEHRLEFGLSVEVLRDVRQRVCAMEPPNFWRYLELAAGINNENVLFLRTLVPCWGNKHEGDLGDHLTVLLRDGFEHFSTFEDASDTNIRI